jgi:mediator of replication checkpoint protein 1
VQTYSVNGFGYRFLTQRRPPSGLPEWALSPAYPLFESSPALSSIPKSVPKQRQPLGTISLAVEDDEDSDNARPRRLRKRAATPDSDDGPHKGGYRSSPSPSPKARNAFDVLGHKPLGKLKAPKFPKKLEKSAFIEGEAEESDEDAGFGFGLVKKDDEEELDGDDQDKILEELVDDAHMDEETLNEEKVLEKVQ